MIEVVKEDMRVRLSLKMLSYGIEKLHPIYFHFSHNNFVLFGAHNQSILNFFS